MVEASSLSRSFGVAVRGACLQLGPVHRALVSMSATSGADLVRDDAHVH